MMGVYNVGQDLREVCMSFRSDDKDSVLFALMELKYKFNIDTVLYYQSGQVVYLISFDPSGGLGHQVCEPVQHQLRDVFDPDNRQAFGPVTRRAIEQLVACHREEEAIRNDPVSTSPKD